LNDTLKNHYVEMAVEKGTEFSAAPERASTSEHDKEQPNGSETRMSVDDVTLDGDENPLNWSKGKKWVSSMIVISMSMTSAFYSGVHASAIDAIAEDYGCSQLASTAGISFFLLGFAAGPLIFAPLSEMFGRNLVIRVSLLIFVITNIGCALAPNIEVLLLFRFLAGFFIAPTGESRYIVFPIETSADQSLKSQMPEVRLRMFGRQQSAQSRGPYLLPQVT
jgi:hypothetical protein